MNDISSLNIKHTRPQEGAQPQGTAPPEGGQGAGPEVVSAAPAEREVGAARTEALAKELNSALEQIDGNYSVSVDGDTGMVVVRITDTDTGELVKQVPPQQVLDASMSVEKIIGLLVNDQA